MSYEDDWTDFYNIDPSTLTSQEDLIKYLEKVAEAMSNTGQSLDSSTKVLKNLSEILPDNDPAAGLPGMRETIEHPVLKHNCKLKDAIISLNDVYKWTREQIADWLDTLDIDLSFR